MDGNVNNVGYQVIVTGLVQGVGFRYFTCKEANKLNIVGSVKNLCDGTVEVKMYGDQQQLDYLLKWLKKGPDTSVVKHLDIKKIAHRFEGGFLSF